jgi:cAMP phosphodiesterase
MKIQLLPSTFDENGRASVRQHLSCFVVDDCVAIDAGSLAMAISNVQREQIRDVILTHAHLDHIAGLPLFIDDLFANLTEPIRIHASKEVAEILERDVLNWSVYPRFSELYNEHGAILEYKIFKVGEKFTVRHLSVESISVNHKVPTVGFIVSNEKATFALTGDTTRMEDFWQKINAQKNLKAILVECAFPNELIDLAEVSHHLTPQILKTELEKCTQKDCPIYVVNIKPMYREKVVSQLNSLNINNLQILEVGKVYEF